MWERWWERDRGWPVGGCEGGCELDWDAVGCGAKIGQDEDAVEGA